MQCEPDMAEQPALLGGKDGGKARAGFVDVDERARLFLDTAECCWMTGDLFSAQRHFLWHSIRFQATTDEDSQPSPVVSSCLLEQRQMFQRVPGERLTWVWKTRPVSSLARRSTAGALHGAGKSSPRR